MTCALSRDLELRERAHNAFPAGVYLHPWHKMFICAAHKESDIEEALQRTEGAFAALQQRFGQG